MNRQTLLAAAMLIAAGPVSAGPLLTSIGVAAAVRGIVRGVPPGQTVGRDVASGKPIYLNDHITTGPDGRLQILLLDQTAFTIGPNSDMVLDEFVYDPKSGAGKVSAQITKGVFRFVTGKIAQRKPSDMKVSLPVGTIGIRGTMVAGSVQGNNADVLLVGPGAENNAHERAGGITVSNTGGSVDINASGYGTSIRDGGAPVPGYRFSSQQSGAILGGLSAAANSDGSSGKAANQDEQASDAQGEPGPGASGGEEEASVAYESGDSAAEGDENAQASDTNVVASDDQTDQTASQQESVQEVDAMVADGFSTWDEILAIPSGTGRYSGSGSWSGCASCSTSTPISGSGSFTMTVDVDFGAQQLTYTSISLNSLSGTAISDSITQNSPVSFAALAQAAEGTGASAVYTFKAADLPAAASSSTSGDFSGSSIQFKNVNGEAGAAADLNMVYRNPSGDIKASGTTTVDRSVVPPRAQ